MEWEEEKERKLLSIDNAKEDTDEFYLETVIEEYDFDLWLMVMLTTKDKKVYVGNRCIFRCFDLDDEYKAGHIPGAVLLTMETITAETAAKVLPDKNQMVLIYCRSGRRSKIAAQNLLDLGYTNLIDFGGILDYKGKVEKE